MSLSLHHEKFTNYPNTAIDNLTQSASVPYAIHLIYLGKGEIFDATSLLLWNSNRTIFIIRIRLCHNLPSHHSPRVSVLEPLLSLEVIIFVHGEDLHIAESCTILLDHHRQPCHGCVCHPDLHPELPLMSVRALKAMLFRKPTNHLLDGTAVTREAHL